MSGGGGCEGRRSGGTAKIDPPGLSMSDVCRQGKKKEKKKKRKRKGKLDEKTKPTRQLMIPLLEGL